MYLSLWRITYVAENVGRSKGERNRAFGRALPRCLLVQGRSPETEFRRSRSARSATTHCLDGSHRRSVWRADESFGSSVSRFDLFDSIKTRWNKLLGQRARSRRTRVASFFSSRILPFHISIYDRVAVYLRTNEADLKVRGLDME